MKEIPKKIHYCWFGEKKKDKLINKCIDSWKKILPEYEIIEWNEKNFDVNQNEYCKEAYRAQKYSFVSDWARLKIIYDNGGIYLDTDVELIKNIEEILQKGAYIGCEQDGIVNTGGGFAAEKNNKAIKKMLEQYDGINFINDGKMDLTPCPLRNTKALESIGWKKNSQIAILEDITVYPKDFFCPLDYFTGEFNITDNTYSIHHYTGAWLEKYETKLLQHKVKYVKIFGTKIGKVIYYIEKFFVLLFKSPKKILEKILNKEK